MHFIVRQPLSDRCFTALRAYQHVIDQIDDIAEQVAKADSEFEAKNKLTNPVFTEIRETLGRMCIRDTFCMYCEKDQAGEIEHIQPKAMFPKRTFDWGNYLYICSKCNKRKGNRYRLSGDKPLFIDPTLDDPMKYLFVDLDVETATLLPECFLKPISSLSDFEKECAEYTIEVLKLNERGLPESRQKAYRRYIDLLEIYKTVEQKITVQPRIISLLNEMPHPTVWQTMQREHERYPQLRELFAPIPEALSW